MTQIQTEDAGGLATGPMTSDQGQNSDRRDAHGRFTKGCRPGPGRPPKPRPRQHVRSGDLFFRSLEIDDVVSGWRMIAGQLGQAGAREFLKHLEAETGPIRHRHLALAAIAAGPLEPQTS